MMNDVYPNGLMLLGGNLMLLAAFITLGFMAKRHQTLPFMMQLAMFGLGFSSLLTGFGMLQEEPCSPQQMFIRAATFGASLLLMVWSMTRKRRFYERHA